MGEEKGVLFAFITALVSGVSVFVNGFAVKGFDPFVYTALKNLLAALLIFGGIMIFKDRSRLSKLNAGQIKWLVLIGIIGGGIPFLLYFQGLSMIAAAKGSFLFRLLFVSSMIFGFVMLKEKPSKKVLAGVAAVLIGNILPLGKENILSFGTGEIFVLAGTAIWGFEYVLSKWAMEHKGLEPQIVGFGRMFFGVLVIFGFLAYTGKESAISTLTLLHWQWILITGSMLFLFVTSFYSALKFTKATTATAILTLGGPITAVLNYVFLGKAPSVTDAFGLLLMTAGIIAIIGVSQIVAAANFAYLGSKRALGWKA